MFETQLLRISNPCLSLADSKYNSLMPRPTTFPCPRCQRKFEDRTTVLNHMNQSGSRCRFHYEELLAISLSQGATSQALSQVSNSLVSSNPLTCSWGTISLTVFRRTTILKQTYNPTCIILTSMGLKTTKKCLLVTQLLVTI